MKNLKSEALRALFYSFCEEKQHRLLPASSLVPKTESSVLFTNSGMLPIMEYLAGKEHPYGHKLYNIQNVVRTGALHRVGDATHETFFEVFGMWDLAENSIEQSIHDVLEFLTSQRFLGIDKRLLNFTCYAGEETACSIDFKVSLLHMGIDENHIFCTDVNVKGPYGETGLYGYNIRIHYDTGKPFCSKTCNPYCRCGKFTEIWDIVLFMYSKTKSGTMHPLPRIAIDMGAGFDRILALLNGADSVYGTDLFADIIKTLEVRTGLQYLEHKQEFHIVADHIRAATFILADSSLIVPSNGGQGYVLRRLIRRALTQLTTLCAPLECVSELAETVIMKYKAEYPELAQNKQHILEQLMKEKERFEQALHKGLSAIRSELKHRNPKEIVTAQLAFQFYATYGVPLIWIEQIAGEFGLSVDTEGFNTLYENHKMISKTAKSKKGEVS